MNESDDELIWDVQLTGSPQAFGELVRRYQGLIRSILIRFTGDTHTADDLAQDTFIRALDHIDQYVIGRSFKAWIGGIAYREFLQHARKEKSLNRKLRMLHDRSTRIKATQEPSTFLDLSQALFKLAEDERNAIILAYAVGMTHPEISMAMGVPLGTVKTWITRGKAKVQDFLGNYDDE